MDIIERAARALTGTLRHHGVEMHPDDIRGAVRDVMAAMREPDDAMERMGDLQSGDCIAIWQAMIDQALRG